MGVDGSYRARWEQEREGNATGAGGGRGTRAFGLNRIANCRAHGRSDTRPHSLFYSAGLFFHVVGEGVVNLARKAENVTDKENYIDFRLRLLGEPGELAASCYDVTANTLLLQPFNFIYTIR